MNAPRAAATLKIWPSRKLEGELIPPGDKAISHLGLILAAAANGSTRLSGFLDTPHTALTLRALQALGARIEAGGPNEVLVEGADRSFTPACEPIECGDSTIAARLLTTLLAGQKFSSRVIGSRFLTSRPFQPLLELLNGLGAKISSDGGAFHLPFSIAPGRLVGAEHFDIEANSPLKACVLLAGLFSEGTTSFQQEGNGGDHSERLIEHFHAPPLVHEGTISIRGGSTLHARDLTVPGDFSLAAFWIALAAAWPEGNLAVRNLGLNPGRTGLLSILLRMGANLRETVEQHESDPYGNVQVSGKRLRGAELSEDETGAITNELPALMVAAALAEGDTFIPNAPGLRDIDREALRATAANLSAFGATIEEKPDCWIIRGSGGRGLTGARVSSHGNHRIALAAAMIALASHGPSEITDANSIWEAYPTFLRDMQQMTDQRAEGMEGFFRNAKRFVRG